MKEVAAGARVSIRHRLAGDQPKRVRGSRSPGQGSTDDGGAQLPTERFGPRPPASGNAVRWSASPETFTPSPPRFATPSRAADLFPLFCGWLSFH